MSTRPRLGARVSSWRIGRFALPTLLLLALAGCLPGAYGSTRPLIKIGLAAPFEGLGRPLGYEALQGVKLALAERNAAGGVGGYMVELVALNDAHSPTAAAAQAAELAADPAVLGVITGWSSDLASVALPAYRQVGLAVVVPWSVPPTLADPSHGLVLLAADSDQVAAALTERLITDARQKIAVVGDSEAVAPYLEQLGSQGSRVPLPEVPGGEVLETWVARLLLARTAPPDMLILVTDGPGAGGIVQAARQTTWTGQILGGPDAASAQLVDVAGAAADGVIIAIPAPTGRDLTATSGERDDSPATELRPRAVLAYDATLVLLSAIESAARVDGRPTREGIVGTLPAVQVRGLTGDIAFGADGRRLDAGVWRYQIEGGNYPGRLIE